jgi:RHS repeat-associated protein
MSMQFTGKERDSESGLDYFGARYYGSALGRFSSPDAPLVGQEASDPQSWNLYSYVRNNPGARVDPDGLDCITTSNQTSGGITVTTVRGGSADTCGGTYVDGTVDVSSYQYNGSSLSWSDNSTWGGGAVNFVSPSTPNDALSPDVASMLNRAGNMAAPGVNLAADGLMLFGSFVAPLPMAIAQFGAGNGDGTDIALAAAVHVPGMGVGRYVKNAKLRNFLAMFNRTGTGIGTGSTADAIRHEIQTGSAVGGKVHFQKGMEMRQGLLNLIRSGKLDASDQAVAKQMLIDIQDALSTPRR